MQLVLRHLPAEVPREGERPVEFFFRQGARAFMPFLRLVREVVIASCKSLAMLMVLWAWRGRSSRGSEVRNFCMSDLPGDLPLWTQSMA